jgi:hypothetical protein
VVGIFRALVIPYYFDKPDMKNFKYFALAMIFFISTATAASQALVTERGQILIPNLAGWELGRNMFGMPFIYFSPQLNGQRSNISFTATGVETDIDLNSLGKNQESYQNLKKNWADSVMARSLSFLPYQVWKNSQGHVVHQIGFTYEHEKLQYVENSFYIDCRGKLIFSKSLRLHSNLQHEGEFKKIINEMDCGQ